MEVVVTATEALLAIGPVVASLATLVVSLHYSRRMAGDERLARSEEAGRERVFQSREHRYEDRRDAVIGLVTAAESEMATIRRWEAQGDYVGLSPGDVHEDYEFTNLNTAYAALSILGVVEVEASARELRDAVYGCFFGSKGAVARYERALSDFQRASRRMLAEE